MASQVPLRATSAASQSAGVPTANLPQIAPKSATPSVTATNGFRPSIPPKNSRVPAGEIDKLSSSKMGNQNNGKSALIGTSASSTGNAQSLAPPPLPHPPIKGISNAQARTARKSAPSTSNRGDGYSTSSSGGGGRKSISGAGKNNKEKRDRESLVIEEGQITPTTGTEGSSFSRSLQSQTPLQAPPKPQPQTQPQTQPQGQKLQQKEAQPSPENGEKPQQKEVMPLVIPAPPSFAGPSVPASGLKRPASPAFASIFSHMGGKPKRQKYATPKMVALASDPGMNTDGSAVKKRKPRKGAAGGGGKEQEKLGKGKGKEMLKGAGVFIAIMGDRCGPEEAIQRLPGPLPYQNPAHVQKQGQQGKKDPFVSQTAAGNSAAGGIKPNAPDAQVLAAQAELPTVPQTNCFVSTSSIQTPVVQRQTPDDVISISSSPSAPMLQFTPDPKLESWGGQQQGAGNKKPMFKAGEQGRHQSTPITIEDGCSSGEESLNGVGLSGGSCGKGDLELIGGKGHGAKKLDPIGYDRGSPGPTQVSEEFFAKCIDDSISDEECVRIENLLVEAKKHLCTSKTTPGLEIGNYIPNKWDSSKLGKIASLLKHMSVLTDDGKVITLDEWKDCGMPKFKGRFILPEYLGVWKETQDTTILDSDTATINGELQPLERVDGRTDVSACMVDVGGKRPISSVAASMEPLSTAAISSNTVPNQEKEKVFPVNDKQEEGLAFVNGSLQPASSSARSQTFSEKPELSTKDAIPQSQADQKPSSPSNQIQAEADASVLNFMPTLDVLEAAAASPVSGRGKRKAFTTLTVEDFLKESRVDQEKPSQRGSSFSAGRQGGNDQLRARIVELNREELRVRDDIDALAAKSKLEETELGRRIKGARVGVQGNVDDGEFDSELGAAASSPIDWEGFRKATRELRDFQDDTRREELRLADKAARIAEEKQYLIERRKRIRRMESELDTTSSSATSEERSSDGGGSTAPTSASPSVSGSSAAEQEISPPISVRARTTYPELSVGHELLRALIPWAMQLQETPAESVPPVSTETGPQLTKLKKKPSRKKKHW